MSDYGLNCCYKSAGVLFVIVIDVWLWCLIMMSDYGLNCCYKSAGVLFVIVIDVWLWCLIMAWAAAINPLDCYLLL